MKNDYTGGGVRISIPPTVMFSVHEKIHNSRFGFTSDFKGQGEGIYILGFTDREVAGSEVSSELGMNAGRVPHVDSSSAGKRYVALHEAIQRRLVSACHDLSDGGLGVTFAEMALGGRCGAEIDFALVPADDMTATELLYSESASGLRVSVPESAREAFGEHVEGQIYARIGEPTAPPRVVVKMSGGLLLDEKIEDLARAFKATLDW